MSLFIETLTPHNNKHLELVRTDLRDFKIEVYKNFYPDVVNWYETKLIKGFMNGSRIIRVVRDSGNLYGLSIIRIDESKIQNKLCTFFLLSEARKSGFGKDLLRLSLQDFKIFSARKPIVVTIPEERARENFNGKTLLDFFEEYNFKLSSILSNRYRLKKDEYVCAKMPKSVSNHLANLSFTYRTNPVKIASNNVSSFSL